jgi:hypothetical protein
MQFQSYLQVQLLFFEKTTKGIYRFVPIDEKSSRMEVEGNVEGPRFWATLIHKGRNQFEKKFIILDDFFKNNSIV